MLRTAGELANTHSRVLAVGVAFTVSYLLVLEKRVSANVFTAALFGMAMGAILGSDPAVSTVVGLIAAVGTESLFPRETCVSVEDK